MDTSRVTLGDKVVVGAAFLLVIDLLFLPWHQVFSFSRTATEAPGGWWGTLAVLLTVAIVALTAVRRFTDVSLPTLPRPIGEVNLAATAVVFAVLAIKLALDTTFLGFGSYLGLLLAASMVAGAFLGKDETDEAPPVGTGPGAPPTPF
ncbi:MAG TPA: hypothetical protein VNS19_05495 [Acidimicrobiales bacterium]|jgi:hypothetical protein|nr:hypothetical protein [Acidimicrobiales bacterium]